MKKIILALVTGALLFCLAGCGSTAPEEKTVLTDEDFIANVSQGLEDRWDISQENLSAMSISEAQAHVTECIEAEKAVLSSLDRYSFADKDLEALAQQYFYALDLQQEGVPYQGTEQYEEYQRTFELGYHYRVITLSALSKEFGLTVEAKYQSTLDDLLAEYNVSLEAVSIQEYVDELMETLDYTKDMEQSDEYATYYMAVIENTTEFTIDSLQIGLSFVDADGVTIEQTADYISDFKAGAKYRSSLYVEADTFDHIEYDVTAYLNE